MKQHFIAAVVAVTFASPVFATPVTVFDHNLPGPITAGTSVSANYTDSFAGDAVVNYYFDLATSGSVFGSYLGLTTADGNGGFVSTASSWSPSATLLDSFNNAYTISYPGISGTYSFLGLGAGSYTLSLGATSNPYSETGSFYTSVSVKAASAVPEPETYAMLLAGLGAMGFLARRRKGS